MIQFIKIVFLLIVLSSITACGGSSGKTNYKNPKSVSLAFYQALTANNLEKAKRVGTESTQKVLVLLQTLADAMPAGEWAKYEEEMNAQLKRLKKAKCEVEQDIATCKICCDETGTFDETTILLKKVDKKWLVHMTKEDLQK